MSGIWRHCSAGANLKMQKTRHWDAHRCGLARLLEFRTFRPCLLKRAKCAKQENVLTLCSRSWLKNKMTGIDKWTRTRCVCVHRRVAPRRGVTVEKVCWSARGAGRWGTARSSASDTTGRWDIRTCANQEHRSSIGHGNGGDVDSDGNRVMVIIVMEIVSGDGTGGDDDVYKQWNGLAQWFNSNLVCFDVWIKECIWIRMRIYIVHIIYIPTATFVRHSHSQVLHGRIPVWRRSHVGASCKHGANRCKQQ